MKKIINKIKQQTDIKSNCIEGCYKCCGVILFTDIEKREMDKELRKQNISTPPNGKGDEMCEYLTTEGKCSVYNKRPAICRMFGTIDNHKLNCELKENVKLVKETFEMIKYGNYVMQKGIINANGQNIMNKFINNPLEIGHQ